MQQVKGPKKVSQLAAVLGLAYPFMSHIAVANAAPHLIALSIGLLILAALMPGLFACRALAWSLLMISAAILYGAVAHGYSLILLFLPPVLINAYLAWLFGRSLGTGQVPIIERAIRALEPAKADIDILVLAYARGLTRFWTTLFVILSMINFLLATFAEPGGILLAIGLSAPLTVPIIAWSIFANFLNYLIVVAVFAVEFQLRQRRFPDQPFHGFLDFLRKLASIRSIFGSAAPQEPN